MIKGSPTREVSWDENANLKMIDEVKSIYIKAKNEGYDIVDLDGKSIEVFKPSLLGFKILEKKLTQTQFSMRILNETGDELLIWDSVSKKEVQEAQKRFDEYIAKGWRAYAVNSDGSTGKRIRTFDADIEELTFADDMKMSFSKFVKSFGKIQMTPKTRAA